MRTAECADTREVSFVSFRSRRVNARFAAMSSATQRRDCPSVGSECRTISSFQILARIKAGNSDFVFYANFDPVVSRIFHGYGQVQARQVRYVFQQFILNLVLQDKASSKALIVRVHLDFVCCTCT